MSTAGMVRPEANGHLQAPEADAVTLAAEGPPRGKRECAWEQPRRALRQVLTPLTRSSHQDGEGAHARLLGAGPFRKALFLVGTAEGESASGLCGFPLGNAVGGL